MKVFNFQIELLVLLQLLFTAIIITAYAVAISTQEAKADYLNECHMVLLISFTIDNHPNLKNLFDIAEAKQEHIDDSTTQIESMAKRLNKFQSSGELPPETSFLGSSLRENLLLMLFAPLSGPFMTWGVWGEERAYRLCRIQHTEMRKNLFSKFTSVLIADLFVLLIVLLFILPRSPFWGYSVMGLILISILTCIVTMSAFVWWQTSWKDFWQGRLLEVMGAAGKQNNHDLFNRAMILKGYIEAQPDIPIPGSLGFYLAVFSGVQGILLFISKFI